MAASHQTESGARWWRKTVFWKVAAFLVGVQVLIGVLAVGLSAYFAYEESLDLVENSLRLRLDGLAEEIERRVPDLTAGATSLPLPLVNDLATRFPDPIVLVDQEGTLIRTIRPDPRVFGGGAISGDAPLPADLASDLESGDVVIQISPPKGNSYGVAPLFDAAGFRVGGVVVIPLDRSVDRELEETVSALRRAALAVALLAGLVAIMIGGVLTWAIIRPIRLMTSSVERIGLGEYAARLDGARDDEFGRLSQSINIMAEKVEESFSSLVATDRLRRDLVANIGHDLRTPLGGILGHIEEARRHLHSGDVEASRTSLDSADRQVGYVTRLVEDLFELSLLDSDVPPLRLEPVPMGELVQQAADGQRNLFASDDTRFEVEIQPGLPVVEADGTRLLRLLQNLLDNARKHAPAGGRVLMTARFQDRAVDVSVTDNGPGIDSDAIEHLFDRYYQGNTARTRTGEGTGLGLAISRAIAEAHGGKLTVFSETGSGTTFRFVLPIDRGPTT